MQPVTWHRAHVTAGQRASQELNGNVNVIQRFR